jgi:tetratricopeptide (TPR) repeat protein
MDRLPTIGVIQFASPQDEERYAPSYIARRLAEAVADCLSLAVAGLKVRNPLVTSATRAYLALLAPPDQQTAAGWAEQLQIDWLVCGLLTADGKLELDLMLYDAAGELRRQQRFVAPQEAAKLTQMVELILEQAGLTPTMEPAEAVAQTLGTDNEQALFAYWQARDVAPHYGLPDTAPRRSVFRLTLDALHADPDYQRAAALFAEAALDLSVAGEDPSDEMMLMLATLRALTIGTACAPITARAYFSLGLKADQQRDNMAALQYYNLALDADPNDFASLAHLGDLRYRLGMRPQALPLLLRACELNPGDDNSAFLVARIYEMQEQSDEALAWYAKAAAARADFWQAHFYAADLLRHLDRREEAVAEFERTLQIDPKQAQTHAELGATLAELGYPNAALPHLEQAAAALPNVTEIQTNIATVKRMLSGFANED